MAINNNINNDGGDLLLRYFLPNAPYPYGLTGSLTSENDVRCIPFVLTTSIIVNEVVFSISTLQAGKYASVGIYSANGDTLLIDSGPKQTDWASAWNTVISPGVRLSPGVYIIAWTSNGTTVQLHGTITTNARNIHNAIVARHGLATNTSTTGQLPASTGAITSQPYACPGVKLGVELTT